MKLSLCIATFNEEKFIHYPLDSCIEWVDEVVIVDGGSTDKTVDIAKTYGKKIRIFHEDNPPMFHINKQKAIERAKGEWILQLDADEEVMPMLKDEILSIVNQELRIKNDGKNHNSKFIIPNTSNVVAYWLPRKNYFLGRFLTKGGVYPDRTIRLYKRGVARFPCKTVHENVEIKGSVGYLKSDLLHYADPDFARYLKRWQRYNNLDAKLLVEKGDRPNIFSYLVLKPLTTFFSMYFRHKGFLDNWQGLVFSFMSSVRHIDIFLRVKKLR